MAELWLDKAFTPDSYFCPDLLKSYRNPEHSSQRIRVAGAVSVCILIYLHRLSWKVSRNIDISHENTIQCQSPSLKSELSAPVSWGQPWPLRCGGDSRELSDCITWLARLVTLCSAQHYNTSYLTITAQHGTVTNIDLPTETGCGLSRNRSLILWIQA